MTLKIISGSLICFATLSLTSCHVNWFNTHYDVPWWKAAVSLHMNDDRGFKCPHCGRSDFYRISDKREDG